VVFANDADRNVLRRQISLLGTRSEGLDSVLDKLFPAELLELREMLFKVGLCRLASGSNGHGSVLIVVCRRASLEKMSSSLVIRADKESNSVRPLGARDSLDLRPSLNFIDKSLSGMLALVDEVVVQALSSHEVADNSGIGCQASNGNSHMVVDVENFLLMRGEFVRRFLERNKNLKEAS
jgi:hypothetical protein